MTRLLPRSLKGQLILLTLVGLLLSQAAGFVVILNDQKSKIKREWLHNIFTRIETVKDVIESTPDEIHSKILKTSSSWALKFAIDPEPLSRNKDEIQSEAVQQEVRRVFGDSADEVDITILLSSAEEPFSRQCLKVFGGTSDTHFGPSMLVPHPQQGQLTPTCPCR